MATYFYQFPLNLKGLENNDGDKVSDFDNCYETSFVPHDSEEQRSEEESEPEKEQEKEEIQELDLNPPSTSYQLPEHPTSSFSQLRWPVTFQQPVKNNLLTKTAAYKTIIWTNNILELNDDQLRFYENSDLTADKFQLETSYQCFRNYSLKLFTTLIFMPFKNPDKPSVSKELDIKQLLWDYNIYAFGKHTQYKIILEQRLKLKSFNIK